VIETSRAPAHTGPVPQAVRAGGWIYVSALFGADPVIHTIPTDPRAEAEQLFANLTAILAAADADLTHVVRVGIVTSRVRTRRWDRSAWPELAGSDPSKDGLWQSADGYSASRSVIGGSDRPGFIATSDRSL
jgi:2-iminobutanoate/2-iminopropanoate deaminase